jgi:glycosyltransferase involved in cell wall biosynthesis
MLPFVKHFRAAGHGCVLASSFPPKYDFFPWMGFRPSQKLKRCVRYLHWQKSRLRQDDVVVVDREIFDDPTTNFEERFRRTTPRFVLDLDDGVFLRYPEKFEKLAAMADLILCGNSYIEEWAVARKRPTIIMPTCIEMAQYPQRPETGISGPVRVGWMGTTGNIKYLAVAAPALRRLASELDLELCVIVPESEPLREIDLTGIRVRHIPWEPNREVEQLHELDIGLMPLFAEQEWDKYKCGLKLLQYMAIGIPAVASPVGVNSTIVSHGRNGLLAANDEEWTVALRSLITEASLRKSIGAAGRATVTEHYSVEANFPRYEAALRGLVDGKRASA